MPISFILFAYIPPSIPTSKAMPLFPFVSVDCTSKFVSMILFPVIILRSFAHIPAFISTALAIKSTRSICSALSPCPCIAIVPLFTLNPFNIPCPSIKGLPVVSITFEVLIKPIPVPIIPFGLAMIKLA